MWESPVELWRRLKLGREEFLQRLITTLIVGGEPPPWNTPRPPSERGHHFLRVLDDVAHHGSAPTPGSGSPVFVDEYLLPKLDEQSQNGWPDWAVLWPDRTWIIELKTEAASHRQDQLPYYLNLAAAAHPGSSLDLTYITGPLTKPAPALLAGQRYTHLTWHQVVPLIDAVWADDARPEVAAYATMVHRIVSNLATLRPTAQRDAVLAEEPEQGPVTAREAPKSKADLLGIARATANDGQQRAVGATDPAHLESLRDLAREQIDDLANDDETRFVLPWLWDSASSGGRALTEEGQEFGYELRFSRYQRIQVSS